jgi:hypothetical protein
MNELTEYVKLFNLNPVKAMNDLQEWVIISDLCVGSEDVAEADVSRARDFVEIGF